MPGLDALRGVAAVLVMLHHAAPALLGAELAPAGYLAVDFFFLLSGFVIAGAFEPRFAEGLDAATFLKLRVARLYPVMAAGILLGAADALFDGTPPALTGLRLAAQLLFVPFAEAGPGLFALDGVQWSLFFELAANLLHAALLARLPIRSLAAVAAVAFAGLAVAAVAHGTIAVGDVASDFWGGVPRVLFSYTLGIALRRRFDRDPGPAVGIGIAPVCGLFVAVVLAAGPVARVAPAPLVQLAIVALVFPSILLLAARARLPERAAALAGLAGRLSFPLYAIHCPLIAAVYIMMVRGHPSAAAFALFGMLALAGSVGLDRLLVKTARLAKPPNAAAPNAGYSKAAPAAS